MSVHDEMGPFELTEKNGWVKVKLRMDWRDAVKVKKGLRFERWRVSVWYRRYKGLGHPQFEFEFKVGFVRRR